MRSFELNIFIDRPRNGVYEHIAEPINMIGLQPLMTTIDILKEQKNTDGIVLRPFYMVETYRWVHSKFVSLRLSLSHPSPRL